MTSSPARVLFSLAALAAMAALSACGNDVPANSVAKVGDSVITKKEFDRWFKNAAMGQGQGGPSAVPEPPDFEGCIAALKKQPQPKGSPKPKEDALKKQCKQQYDQLKQEVMQFLIQAEWVQQEAEAQGVKVSDAEVRKSFEDKKKQAFPKEADYKKFLNESGMSEEDILFRVKLDTLQPKLTQKVTEGKTKVTDEEITAYYRKNKKRFAQPERRDLNLVLTKTKAKADEAKRALQSGTSFKAAAKRFSIDQASKAQGGKLPDVTKNQQDKAVDKAAFSAKRGQLLGPIKGQFGFAVLRVTKIKPASQQSLPQAKETIRNLLRGQKEQKALNKFIKDFRENYKEKTNCADEYRVAECKNAPKEKTDTGPASGGAPGSPQAPPGGAPQPGAPQGAPQPGAPQQGAPQPGAPQGAPQGGGAAPTPAPQAPAPPEAGRGAAARAGALTRLDDITRRLRTECPWDREQDERSIVPHTIEEAYELADAAHSGDDAKLVDELGDVLFQVLFLSLLLEERGKGDIAAVADHCREKLVRRHPHVFGDMAAETAGEVLANWNQIKRENERGGAIFGELPQNLPATLYARKVQKRAHSAGRAGEDSEAALGELRSRCERLLSSSSGAREQDVGELLFHAVQAAGALGVDPEIALRREADRFKAAIEESEPI